MRSAFGCSPMNHQHCWVWPYTSVTEAILLRRRNSPEEVQTEASVSPREAGHATHCPQLAESRAHVLWLSWVQDMPWAGAERSTGRGSQLYLSRVKCPTHFPSGSLTGTQRHLCAHLQSKATAQTTRQTLFNHTPMHTDTRT